MPTTTPAVTPAVFDDISKAVKAELVQRDVEVDSIILALIARVHILFLGEPGIAKTLVVNRLIMRMLGVIKFYRAFGPFTAPEHVFGNQSIKGLKNDEQRYITKGKLPEAHVGVFDEWTRVGNASMQEMLQAWNERTFDQDGVETEMPLMAGIFLCNFLIDEKDSHELAAAYDRILFRKTSDPVLDPDGLRALDQITLEKNPPTLLTLDQLEAAQAAAAQVVIPDDVVDKRIEIFGKLLTAGLRPSNRRHRENLALVRATAWLAGRDHAIPEDLDVTIDTYWSTPDQRREVERIVWEVSSPGMKEVSKLIDGLAKVTTEIEGALDITGDTRETSLFAAQKTIKRHARKVQRLQGQGPKTDTALSDVWRRLQRLHDRIMLEGIEVPAIPLEVALTIGTDD
jgi:MoxR-like ATPase